MVSALGKLVECDTTVSCFGRPSALGGEPSATCLTHRLREVITFLQTCSQERQGGLMFPFLTGQSLLDFVLTALVGSGTLRSHRQESSERSGSRDSDRKRAARWLSRCRTCGCARLADTARCQTFCPDDLASHPRFPLSRAL